MDIKNLIFELTTADFIGSVRNCQKVIKDNIAPFVDKISERYDGTLIAEISGDENVILLEAHIDQVGFVVTEVFDDGFVRVEKVGSPDIRTLPASELVIYGKKVVYGTVCSTPPHLQKGSAEKFSQLSEMLVDTGLSKDTQNIVSVGDFAAFSIEPKSLQNDNITAKSLDDRTACAALIKASEIIKNSNIKSTVRFVFSQAEEINGSGAMTAAFESDADIALCCDVSFAQTPGVKPHKSGKFGGGVMIGISPVLSKEISNTLKAICEEKDIPYQLEVMGGLTSTDVDKITLSKQGIASGLVSIPLKNMHTPVEVVNLKDVENTAKLMAQFAIKKDGERNAQ